MLVRANVGHFSDSEKTREANSEVINSFYMRLYEITFHKKIHGILVAFCFAGVLQVLRTIFAKEIFSF